MKNITNINQEGCTKSKSTESKKFKKTQNHVYETEQAKSMIITLKLRNKLSSTELEWFRLLYAFPLPFSN